MWKTVLMWEKDETETDTEHQENICSMNYAVEFYVCNIKNKQKCMCGNIQTDTLMHRWCTHSILNKVFGLFWTESSVLPAESIYQWWWCEAQSHHIAHYWLCFIKKHLHSHKRGIAHVICKSQIVAPDANRCTEAKCQRALAKAASDFKVIWNSEQRRGRICLGA